MEDFRYKQRVRRFLYSRLTIGVLAVIVLFVGYKTWGIYEKERLSREMLEQAKASHGELSLRALALSADIESLKTEAGFEEAVRDRYGVAKEGEEIVVLVDDEDTHEEEEERGEGFWDKIKEFFVR